MEVVLSDKQKYIFSSKSGLELKLGSPDKKGNITFKHKFRLIVK